MYKILTSGSRQSESHPLRLFLTHGCARRFRNKAIAFEALGGIFANQVMYPLEQALKNHSAICFERVIHGKIVRPYFTEVGRFGANNQWKGIVQEFRDWVFESFGVPKSGDVGNATNELSGDLKKTENDTSISSHDEKPKFDSPGSIALVPKGRDQAAA